MTWCAWCGNNLWPKQKQFCSKSCHLEHRHSLKPKPVSVMSKCAWCRQNFAHPKWKNRKFECCSHACRLKRLHANRRKIATPAVIINLYVGQRLSTAEVAQRCGLKSKSSVRRLMVLWGIPRRKRT